MNVYQLLFALPTKGFLWFIFLFAVCFFGVHVFRLALIGIESVRQNPVPPQEKIEEKKAPAEQPQEPIYYIVERKTRRKKASFGEPKEIRFK